VGLKNKYSNYDTEQEREPCGCAMATPPRGGVVERKAKRGRALGRLVPQEGVELDTVVSGSAGKRRRNGDDRNDRNIKRSAVMRVYTAGGGSGS
jgi:hypothetical protein